MFEAWLDPKNIGTYLKKDIVDPAFNNALMKSGTQKEDPKSDKHLTNHTHMRLTDHSEPFMSAMNRKRQRKNHRLIT
jgi:hypothetical protein